MVLTVYASCYICQYLYWYHSYMINKILLQYIYYQPYMMFILILTFVICMATEMVNNGRLFIYLFIYLFMEITRQPYHKSTGLLNKKPLLYYCHCETHRITCKQVASVSLIFTTYYHNPAKKIKMNGYLEQMLNMQTNLWYWVAWLQNTVRLGYRLDNINE